MNKLFLLLCITLWLTFFSNNNLSSQNSLKKGDWFECEMEFEDELPVFRNHWFRDSTSIENTSLISARFTFEGKTDSIAKWSYKVLRLKYISDRGYFEHLDYNNLYCYDTWYLNYFNEDSEALRDSMKGSIETNGFIITSHQSTSHNTSYTTNSILPIKVTKNDYGGSSLSVSGGNPYHDLIETMLEFITLKNNISVKKINSSNFKYAINTINNTQSEIEISVYRKNKSKSYTTFNLDNQLNYAAEDENKQKVQIITNASFPIPNKATLTIIDKRNQKKLDDSPASHLVKLYEQNPAHIINETGNPGFLQLKKKTSTKQYTLKCGVAFNMYLNRTHSINIFLKPQSNTTITILDDKKFSIENNDDSKWWNEHNNNTTGHDFNKADVSEEFKNYLLLKNEIKKRKYVIRNNPEFKTEILDFIYLKSYHYKGFGNNSYPALVFTYNDRKNDHLLAAGIPYRSGFKYKYHNAISHHNNFMLYHSLFNTLKGRYAYYQIRNNPEVYKEFLKQCGDTLLNKHIYRALNYSKQLQAGKTLPFTSLLSENEETMNPLSIKKDYGILLIYNDHRALPDFRTVFDSLPENINLISYKMNRGRSNGKDKPEFKSLKNELHILGHPASDNHIQNYLIGSLQDIYIIYDKN